MASLAAMLAPGTTPASTAPAPVPAAPADTRPPAEIYAAQLAQMHDMGLDNDEENIRALQSTSGNVQFAIERIFSQRG